MRLPDVLETFRGRGSFALLLWCLIPAAAAAAFVSTMDLAFVPATVVTLCVSVTARLSLRDRRVPDGDAGLARDRRFDSLQRTCELMTVTLFGPLFF